MLSICRMLFRNKSLKWKCCWCLLFRESFYDFVPINLRIWKFENKIWLVLEKLFSNFFQIFFKSFSIKNFFFNIFLHTSKFLFKKYSLSKTSKVKIYMKCFSLKALILHFVQCANILFFILQMYGLVDFSLGCATKHYRYGMNKYIQKL